MSMEPVFMPPRGIEETAPVDAVRGFVFCSGRTWLKAHGHLERYLEFLPPALRTRAFTMTALEWIDLPSAMACYEACDRLTLSSDEQHAIGAAVSSANNGVVIETMARLAGGLGVSPWVALKGLQKVWLRSNRGGAVAIYKLGERSARIELWKVPLVASPFFRTSMCGALESGIALFNRGGRVVEIKDGEGPDTAAFRATW